MNVNLNKSIIGSVVTKINVTKDLVAATTNNIDGDYYKSYNKTTGANISLVIPNDDSLSYILIPLGVLFTIIILSALVYLMARNRRRLEHIYFKRKYSRNYLYDDDSDITFEQGEYDLDDPTECLLKGKLQIDNSYESYQKTQANIGKRELYT